MPNYNNSVKPDYGWKMYDPESFYPHPPGKNDVDRDTGLIKLKEPVDLREFNLGTAKIDNFFEPKIGDELVVAGWGRTEDGLPDYLLKTTVLLTPDEKCEKVFNVKRVMYLRGAIFNQINNSLTALHGLLKASSSVCCFLR